MYFIYRPDLDEDGEHPLDFIGWYSQDEESVAALAQRNQDFNYFEAFLTFDDPDRPIDMNEVAIPTGFNVSIPHPAHVNPQSRFGEDELMLIVGQMPGTIWQQSVINVWCLHPGVSFPYQPYFVEEELQEVALEFPDQIFFIGGVTDPFDPILYGEGSPITKE